MFMALVGHNNSDGLPNSMPYSESLERFLENQPEVNSLAKSKKFISTGYVYRPQELVFNECQTELILNWLKHEN